MQANNNHDKFNINKKKNLNMQEKKLITINVTGKMFRDIETCLFQLKIEDEEIQTKQKLIEKAIEDELQKTIELEKYSKNKTISIVLTKEQLLQIEDRLKKQQNKQDNKITRKEWILTAIKNYIEKVQANKKSTNQSKDLVRT